ncbi:hypothetical protein Tsubulata_037815 [Turnera subulata]|uniref:DUF4283 domain-containing protein n=1 Tax=Turnera subulata TaxID=218843 RepID=A0A9Q0FW15_9ROSI|nr:hypothetical protein Tsubulata_037815 [Turnera subulata]
MAIESDSSVYDSNGALCTKPEMALDLNHLDLLLKASTPHRIPYKGKNVAALVLAPVDPQAPIAISRNLRPIAPPSSSSSRNLGLRVSSNATLAPNAPILPTSASVAVQSPIHAPIPPTEPTPRSWATVASGNSQTFHQPLQFVPNVLATDSKVLTIPPNLLELGRKKFSLCLVGQFMGNAPKLGFINAMATKLWGKQRPVLASQYNSGLFLLKFPTDAALQRALHGGPWHIGGVPLLLHQWSPNIKSVDFNTPIIPVWVQLNRVPVELLTNEVLSYISSAIGKPLHLNQDCSNFFSERVSVCIAVDFSKPILHNITIAIDGCTRTIYVSYSWQPQLCELCHTWGHHQFAYPSKRPVTKWIPKSAPKISDPMASSSQCPVTETLRPPPPTLTVVQSQEAVNSATVVTPMVASDALPHQAQPVSVDLPSPPIVQLPNSPSLPSRDELDK